MPMPAHPATGFAVHRPPVAESVRTLAHWLVVKPDPTVPLIAVRSTSPTFPVMLLPEAAPSYGGVGIGPVAPVAPVLPVAPRAPCQGRLWLFAAMATPSPRRAAASSSP